MIRFLSWASKGLQKVFEAMIMYGLSELMKPQ